MQVNSAKPPRPVPEIILYEHPLNERVRTFLRLEFLFNQAAHHLQGRSDWDSRATMDCILEILAIFGNTNLKSEVLQELERQGSNLKRLEQNPDIDHAALDSLMADIQHKMDQMYGIDGQIAGELNCSEFLLSIRQRSAIPGGTCDFDLPSFHYWLQQSATQRTRDLAHWLGNFDAIGQAIQLILKLTRDSTPFKTALASGGVYQQALDPNLPCQLVRIALPDGVPYFAELSGGRHRFTARFLEFSTADERARQTSQDVEFELSCCVI
jgi:cell division protein ZapD